MNTEFHSISNGHSEWLRRYFPTFCQGWPKLIDRTCLVGAALLAITALALPMLIMMKPLLFLYKLGLPFHFIIVLLIPWFAYVVRALTQWGNKRSAYIRKDKR